MKPLDSVISLLSNNIDELYDILKTLISFKTPNPPGYNERHAQEWISHSLTSLGFQVEVFEALPDRPNVIGRLKANGSGGKSIILNGHIDVCEDRLLEKWEHDPYEAVIKDGFIFGKGSSDMKGALACFLFVLKCFKNYNLHLRGDVLFESVIGEEVGEPGTKACIEKGHNADFAIVGESAKGATVLYAAVGLTTGHLTIRSPYTLHLQERRHFKHAGGGREGANCIEKMAEIVIPALENLERQWSIFKQHPLMPPGQAMINVFNIVGGGNIFFIPDVCTIDFVAYYLPGETKKSIQNEIEEKINEAARSDSWLSKYPPTVQWDIDPDKYQFIPAEVNLNHPGVKLLIQSYREATGKDLSIGGRGVIVDSGWFAQAGIPVVTFGPGDAYWAHRIGERVELQAMKDYCKTLAIFLAKWCGLTED